MSGVLTGVCASHAGLVGLRQLRAATAGYCGGYQYATAASVKPPQPHVDDATGELTFTFTQQ